MTEKSPEEISKIILKRFDVDGKSFNEGKVSSRLFILKYWLEKCGGGREEKERYKYLDGRSFVRGEYENILKTHEVDNRYVRVIDNLVYVSLRGIGKLVTGK